MISSRARSILYAALAVSLFASTYLSWTISSKNVGQLPSEIALISATASGFNITIILSWITFGISGGIAVTVAASVLLLLLGFRTGFYGCNILILPFALTAWVGFSFASGRNRMNQLYTLRSEKMEEEKNIFINELKDKNIGITAFEDKLKRYSALKGVVERFSAVLSLEDITASIIEKTTRTLGRGGRVLLFLADQDKHELMLSFSNAKNHQVIRAKKGDIFDQWVVRNKKALMVEDTTRDFRFSTDSISSDELVFRSIISSPLISGNKVIGVLRTDNPNEFAYTQDDLRLLDIIANLGAVAIQNALLYSRTQELAIRDGLTGLKVRRFFMESFYRC
jgi:GAF domain